MESTNTGTEVKFILDIGIADTSLTGEEFDFTARFFTFSNRFVDIPKSAMVATDDGCYIAIVNTSILGEGEVKVEVVAQVPDNDLVSGYREERATIRTGVMLKRSVYELS